MAADPASVGAAAPARRLLRAGAWYGAAVAAANLLHVLFHVVLARALAPVEYSLLAALLAVLLVAGVPAVAMQAAVARGVARALDRGGAAAGGGALRAAARSLVRILPAAVAILAAASLPLALVLDVRSAATLAATGVAAALALALPLAWGGLQGAQRFGALSLAQLGHVLLKLGLGVGAALAGWGVAGVVGGVAAAAAAAVLVASAVPLRGTWRAGRGRALAPLPLLGRYGSAAAVALTAFAWLTASDLLVARALLDAGIAGAYAAASVGARGLLVLPAVVTTVLFPHVATLGDAARERRHLLAGVGVVAAASAALVALLVPLAPGLVRIVFGPAYADAARWLPWLAAAMGLYAVAHVYLFHALSVARTRYVALPLVVALLQFGAYAVAHGSPAQLVGVQLACAALLVAASEAHARRRR